ncbi:hypothetical protein PFDSM3638_02740 [Pyrococcus furiosus DSM 3638]|uniref:Uncharacterized protein n=3 Tax=Pyrococcus furiosus TaxID=2261 RepID=A0A5C0XMZ8_PYRFU|nr:hypothetical protein [Pyrococcus furiosus]AAL80670.1 hypothetical protein PF0546 [Pyrococcus furiosus DSM 3638]AFN03342.1 hypothetical protein PFC_01855 [Pyrococcus furiosus COM1]QEK78257.1 hypothetical protein PFDSM3638_02740 [Pyrococcus furiosus DSM 3638]
MVIDEILELVPSIPDPFVRVLTYGRIGVYLSKIKDPRAGKAFRKAFEELSKIEDPYILVRALLAIGYSTSLAGLKSAKKAFREAISSAQLLPEEIQDIVKAEAIDYLLSLKDTDEAVFYAVEIKNKKLRNKKLLEILEKVLENLEGEKLNKIYKRRKVLLILETIEEPYREEAIVKSIKPLLSLGEYKLVLELINSIGSKLWIAQALNEVLEFLKNNEENSEIVKILIEESEELAKKVGEDIREDIAYIFAIHGFIQQSIEVLKTIPPTTQRIIVREILTSLLSKEDLDKLKILMESLPPDMVLMVKDIIFRILERGSPKMEPMIQVLLEKEGISEDILVGITKYYLELNNLQQAVRVIKRINSERHRSVALGFLAHYLIRIGRVGDAIDVVLNIKDRGIASKLASELLVKVVEGKVNEKINTKKEAIAR